MNALRDGNENLLALATYIQTRNSWLDKMINHDENFVGYDQTREVHRCGAPACALGHASVLFEYNLDAKGNPAVGFYSEDDRAWAMGKFHLDGTGYNEIFSSYGCGGAGSDWSQAVAFIRNFVEARKV